MGRTGVYVAAGTAAGALLAAGLWALGAFEGPAYVWSQQSLPDGGKLRLVGNVRKFGPEAWLRASNPSGDVVWELPVANLSAHTPVVVDDTVYLRVHPEGDAAFEVNRTLAIEWRSGELRWRSDPTPAAAGLTNSGEWGRVLGRLWVEHYPGDAPYVRALRMTDGEEAWRVPLPDGAVNAYDVDGTLHVLGPEPWPREPHRAQWALAISATGDTRSLLPEDARSACLAGRALLYLDAKGHLWAQLDDAEPLPLGQPGPGRIRCTREGTRWVVAWSSPRPQEEKRRRARERAKDLAVYDAPPAAVAALDTPFGAGCALMAFEAPGGQVQWARHFPWGQLRVPWDRRIGTGAVPPVSVTVEEPPIFVGEEVGDDFGAARHYTLALETGRLQPTSPP